MLRRVDDIQLCTKRNYQYYANKCVLRSVFADAVHTRDLNKSEKYTKFKALMYKTIWKNREYPGNYVVNKSGTRA